MPRPTLNLTGNIYGELTVIRRVKNDSIGRTQWLCSCSCGNKATIQAKRLLCNHTRSCGCLLARINRERATHGMTHTPEYRAWTYMITRATNPRIINARSYRDVTVYPEWRTSFKSWLAHVGPKPSPQHSLDRFPDPWGSYEPGNVRWATAIEQANNKRTNRLLTYNGKTQTIPQWAREIGRSPYTLYDRARKGWTDADVLTLPLVPAGQYPRTHTSRLLTYSGRTQSVSEWARELNLPYTALYLRAYRGWSDAEALTVPFKGRKK